MDAIVALDMVALAEARQVDLQILRKANSNLSGVFREKYLAGLERMGEVYAGQRPDSEYIVAAKLINEWVEWLNTHTDDIRLPKH